MGTQSLLRVFSRGFLLTSLFLIGIQTSVNAQDRSQKSDLDFAPASFKFLNSEAVFVDFKSVESVMKIDIEARKATIETTIDFHQPKDGHFILDLVPKITGVKLDGKDQSPKFFYLSDDPDQVTKFLIALLKTKAGDHSVTISHELPRSNNLKFGIDTVDFMTRMSDLSLDGNKYGRGFMERYFPSNLEWDQYDNEITIEVLNTDISHMIKTNGELRETAKNTFEIDFPDHFNSSSFFIHLFNPKYYLLEKIQGVKSVSGKEMDFLVYGRNPREIKKAKAALPKYFKELESTFGEFMFPFFYAHITLTGGGMEYGGATDTSNWALSHEMFHSYFARGVKPASGNSGWIDEGLARWRDQNYVRHASAAIKGQRARLSGFSKYRRHTSIYSYDVGSFMFSKIDRALVNEGQRGGLRPILKRFAQEHRHQVINTKIFFDYLQAESKTDLKPYFDYFVFGK